MNIIKNEREWFALNMADFTTLDSQAPYRVINLLHLGWLLFNWTDEKHHRYEYQWWKKYGKKWQELNWKKNTQHPPTHPEELPSLHSHQ